MIHEAACKIDEAASRDVVVAHAGAEMARDWNLPDALVEAIAFHQNPTRAASYPRLVSQVHLGNILCLSFGIGTGNDGLAYAFHPRAMAELGLEVKDLYRLSLRVHAEFRKAEELVGLAAAA